MAAPTIERVTAQVTYDDGHTETFNTSRPIYAYQASGLVDLTDGTASPMYILTWFAAGKPGANGAALTPDTLTAFVESWLSKLERITLNTEEIPTPPTKRRSVKQGSAG